jgi:hypothetical protein
MGLLSQNFTFDIRQYAFNKRIIFVRNFMKFGMDVIP